MGKAGVGIDDLCARLGQGQDDVEHDGLGAGGDHHLPRVGVDAAHLPAVAGHGLAQFGQAGRGPVVGIALLQSANAGVNDMLWSIEVGFANLQVDDFPALGLERPRLGQYLESGLGAQVVHSFCQGHSSSS